MPEKIRILYIDDNPMDRALIRDSLEKEHGGFNLTEAQSQAEFERIIAEQRFDVVLTDFNILGYEGLDVLDTVKDVQPDTPVIIVTGTGSETIAVEAMKRGAADYVIKSPNHIKRLPHTIFSTLKIKNAEAERKKTAAALYKNEERMRVALKNSPVTVWNQDKELRYTWIYNPHAGFKPETLLGKKDEDLLSAEDAANLTRIKQSVLKSGKGTRQEVQTTIDGKEFFYDLTVEPMTNKDGQTIGITCSTFDISERKRAEKKLQESREHLQNIFDVAPVGIGIVVNREIQFVNNEICRLIGYDPDELLGKNARILYPDNEEYNRVGSIKQSRLPELGRTIIETRFQKKSKEIIDVLMNSTYINRENPDEGIISMVVDISERKMAQIALQDSEKHLKNLLESIQAGVVVHGKDSAILDCNAKAVELLGLSREQLLSTDAMDPYWQLLHENGTPLTLEDFPVMQVIRKKKAVYDYVVGVKRKDRKNPIWLLVSGMPQFDKQGEISLVINTFMDISGRRITEQALKESEAKLKAIFNNSLNAIMVADDRGNYIMVNQAAADMFGHNKAKMLKMNVDDLMTTRTPDAEKRYHEYMKKGRDVGEFDFIRPDGEHRIAIYHAVHVRKNFNLSILSDITDRKLAEQELVFLNQTLEAAQKMAKVGYWRYDIKNRQPIWSDQMFPIFGMSKEDGQPSYEDHKKNWHPDDWEMFDTAVKDCIKGKPYNIVIRVWFPEDQSYHYIQSQGFPKKDESGKITELYGTSQDITEIKKAEATLRKNEQDLKYRNQIAESFVITGYYEMFHSVLKVLLEKFNSRYGYFGYINDNGDLVCPSMTWDIWSKCDVEDKDIVFPKSSWGGLWGENLKSKKNKFKNEKLKVPGGHVQLENALVGVILSKNNVIGQIALANNKNGYSEDDLEALTQLCKYISPLLQSVITERKHQEELLLAKEQAEENEAMFHAAMDNSQAGIAIAEVPSGKLKYVNKAGLMIRGKSHEELVRDVDIEKYVASWQILHFDGTPYEPDEVPLSRAVLYGEQVREEFIIRRDNHEDRVVLAHAAPIKNEDGKRIAAIVVFLDITEQKHAEQEQERLQVQLNQAHKMESVGRLAGGVAHDFNNMLNVILGHTELSLDALTEENPLNDSLKEIRKAAKRSADLTRQLLAFARRQTVVPQVLDLNYTISNMLKMLTRLIGEDIDLLWKPAKKPLQIHIDPSQIDQILANLMVNARDAIESVGKITIETGQVEFDESYCENHAGFVPGEFALLAVSDDGKGMDEETQKHIFEPFYTTKEVGEGTGLGLATVYGIVKQNDGFINVYSEPGKGTTFHIYFPKYSVSDSKPMDKEAGETSVERGSETILFVEDEPAILSLGKTMLERLGYKVITAATPGKAIQSAREHKGDIHLLITDVVMPEMNGRELAKRLLSLYPQMKRLFMSGYTANVIAHHGVLDEGVNFIQKPFSTSQMSEKIREALDGA